MTTLSAPVPDLQGLMARLAGHLCTAGTESAMEVWAHYEEAFRDLPAWLPPPPEKETRHARHMYTILLDTNRLRGGRDEGQLALHRQRIGTGIHYRALHLHRYYRETFGYTHGDPHNAEWISQRTLSLPLSPKLSDDDVEDVIFAVRRTLEYFAR